MNVKFVTEVLCVTEIMLRICMYVCMHVYESYVLRGFTRLGHVLHSVFFGAKGDKLYCEQEVCYICLHRNINHVTYVIIRVLRSYRRITRL